MAKRQKIGNAKRRGPSQRVKDNTLFQICLSPQTHLPGVGNTPVQIRSAQNGTSIEEQEATLKEMETYCTQRGAPVFWSTMSIHSQQPVLYVRVPSNPEDSAVKTLQKKGNYIGASVKTIADDFPPSVLAKEAHFYLYSPLTRTQDEEQQEGEVNQ